MSKIKISSGIIRMELKAFQKQILDAQKKIETLNAEISKIQNKCPHDGGWEDTTYYWAPAHGTPGKACNVCGKFISSINHLIETTITTAGPDNESFEVFDLQEQKMINDKESKK